MAISTTAWAAELLARKADASRRINFLDERHAAFTPSAAQQATYDQIGTQIQTLKDNIDNFTFPDEDPPGIQQGINGIQDLENQLHTGETALFNLINS